MCHVFLQLALCKVSIHNIQSLSQRYISSISMSQSIKNARIDSWTRTHKSCRIVFTRRIELNRSGLWSNRVHSAKFCGHSFGILGSEIHVDSLNLFPRKTTLLSTPPNEIHSTVSTPPPRAPPPPPAPVNEFRFDLDLVTIISYRDRISKRKCRCRSI